MVVFHGFFFSLAIYTLGNEFFLSEKTSCEKDL